MVKHLVLQLQFIVNATLLQNIVYTIILRQGIIKKKTIYLVFVPWRDYYFTDSCNELLKVVFYFTIHTFNKYKKKKKQNFI